MFYYALYHIYDVIWLLSQFTMVYYSEDHINKTILHAIVTFTIVSCFCCKKDNFKKAFVGMSEYSTCCYDSFDVIC